MKTSKSKKVLSLIMAVIMMFTVVPATIFAQAEDSYPMMEAYNAASSADYHKYYNKVYSVTFLDEIDSVAINGALESWDVSAAKDGSVKAWMYKNEEASTAAGADRYDVYIAGDGGVAANPDSSWIFYLFSQLKEIRNPENFKTSEATNFTNMFMNCTSLENIDLKSWDVSKLTTTKQMFYGCSALTEIDLCGWNTHSLTDVTGMFNMEKATKVSALKNANLSGWDASKITTLKDLFHNCQSLENVDLSDWNTSNVTSMENMFKNCYELTELDLTSFDTSKVTTMRFMFYLCKKLLYIYAGDGWTTKSIANLYDGVFNCCYAKFGSQEEYEKNPNPPVSGLYAGFEEEGGYITKAYNVRYEFKGDVVPNGETAPEKVLYEAGESVVVEENPRHVGYTFSGWETTDADISTGTFEIENDVLIVGEWTKITAENIEVEKDVFELKPGETDKINVTVKPDGVAENGVTFESSDENVVKVDEDGNITAVGEGTAVIKITSKDNEVVYVEVGVTVAYEYYDVTYEFIGDTIPEGVVAPTEATYRGGSTVDVEANPTAKYYEFSGWSTSDATVEDDGSFVINNDVHFVGKWTKLYKVEYRYTEGYEVPVGAPALPVVTYHKAGDEVDKYGVPYVDRYLFIGWTTDDADITGDMFTMPENDVVIYGYFKIPVESIEIMGEDVTINKDGTSRLNVYVKPEDATIKDIVYESSNENVAIIDKYGNIKAVGEGTAIITVKSKDDSTKSDTITVTVKVPVTDLTVNKTEINLNKGGGDSIVAKVNPDATNQEIEYSSSDDKVATVDKDGNIIAVGEGEAIITVKSNDNPNFTETVKVTVKVPVTEITSTDDFTINIDEVKNLEAKVNEDATNQGLIYESSDPGVAKVDNDGNVIGVGEGTATITIISKDNSEIQKTVEVTVEIPEYTVTYTYEGDVPANAPAVPDKESYEEGTNVIVEANPAVDGYIFSGWSTEDADITKGNFDIYNDVVIIGKWTKINYYNVEYKYEGDVPANVPTYETKSYKEGTNVTVESNPSVDGYIFSGWSTEDADITNGNFDIYNDVVIIGKWTKINYYNVEYKYEGDVPANAPTYETKSYKEGTNVIVESNPSVDGYIFSGWSTDDADITNGNFDIYNDVVIIGTWTKLYNVTYEYEGDVPANAPAVPDKESYKAGTIVDVENAPSLEGYTFSGWSTSDATVTDGEFTMPEKDVVLKGEWTKINYYNVEYKYEGDVPANAPAVPDKESYKAGTIVDVENAPSLEGYTFSGWSTTDATVADGEFTMPEKDVVLKGKWTKINYYNVEYKYEGDVPANAPTYEAKSYKEGTNVIVESNPVVDGYIFSGWSTEDTDITNGNFDIYNDVVIIGKWTKINYYNVEYKYEGDVPANAPTYETKSYKEGTNVIVESNPAVDGYKFLGWTSKDANISNGNFNITNNVTIVGRWEILPGPVTEVVAPDKLTLVLGQDSVLEAYVNSNAVNKGLYFISNNEDIIKIDETGKMTTVGAGTALITIASVENPAIYKVVEITVTAKPAYQTKHYIVFGKTEKIGWYSVSLDGGKTFFTQFGNDHLEVEHGTEIIVRANDVFGDPFTFYINGNAVTPDENGYVRVLVDQYILVGALGIPVVAPDAEESLNLIQKIIKAIKDFFAKIAALFKF